MQQNSPAANADAKRVLLVGMGRDMPHMPGCEVVRTSGNIDMLHLLSQDSNFNLIMGDLDIPNVLTKVCTIYPQIPVLVMAHQPSLAAAFQAGQAGAAGYVPATADMQTLRTQMDTAMQQAAPTPVQRSATKRHARVKKHAAEDDDTGLLHVRELTIDRHRQKATFRQHPLDLTPRQFDILANLVENKGRVVLFEELAHMLRGNYPHHDEARRALSAHMSNLREALTRQGCDGYILSSRGRGFVIESDVEERLRQTEARLRLVLEQMPCVMWSTDTELTINWAGGAELTAAMNMQSEDMVGISLYDLLRNEGPDSPSLQAHERGLQGETVIYERQRGLDSYYQGYVEPLRDADGKIIGTIGLALNITERKRAEEALRRSEQLYHTLVSNLPKSAVYLYDHDLRFLIAGGAALRDIGLSRDRVEGATLYDLASPEYLALLEPHYRAALAGDEHIFELVIGERIYYVHTLPVRNDDGEVFAGMVVSQEITERKQAEERLRESEERYRLISGMMSDYVYAARLLPGDEYQTEVEWVAGALTRITGFTEEDVRSGMKWDKLVHPEDRDIVERRRKALLEGKQDISEFRMTGKHGQTYWVQTYTYPVWDEQEGRVVKLYAAVKDITQQKAAQEALRASEEHFRKVSEVMSDYVYSFRIISQRETRLEWMTGAYERITGYTIEEAMRNVGWSNIIHPDDMPLVYRRLERLMAGESDTSEWRIITRDGAIRWLRMYGKPEFEDGRVVRVYAGAEDITEQRRVDEALRESQANIRRIVEEAPTPMLLFQGTKVVYTNPAIVELSGYSREEWLTMDFYEVIHPDMREAAIERARRRQRGEKVRSRYEVRIIHKNGEERWIDYMATVIQYEGAPAVLAIVADITQRKALEATLRQTEADLRGIVASTPAPMLIFQETMMRFVNPAAEALTGYTLDELIQMTFWDVIHPDMRDLIRERGMRRQEGAPVPQRYEVKLLTKGGETRWVDYMGTLIQYEGAPAVLGIVFDITDRKQAEATLREGDERLISVLQHMPIMVDAFDEQGRIVVWNRECELVTGYSAREITDHPNPMQLLYPDPDYLHPRMAEWEARGGNWRNWEWDLVAKDGSIKTISWSNISAKFPLSGWKTWGIGVDVTARKAAEQALYQTEEQLRMVISSAPVVLWAINKDGIYTLSEGKALEAIGYEPGEAVGRSIFEINCHLPDVLRNVRRALAGESFTAPFEANQGVDFETHYIPVCDDGGYVTDVLGVSILKGEGNGQG